MFLLLKIIFNRNKILKNNLIIFSFKFPKKIHYQILVMGDRQRSNLGEFGMKVQIGIFVFSSFDFFFHLFLVTLFLLWSKILGNGIIFSLSSTLG